MIARTALRRETPALRTAFLSRDTRLADDDRRLADYQSAPPGAAPPGAAPPGAAPPAAPPGATPLGAPVTPASGVPAAVFSIRPLAGSPTVSRLATDGRLLRAAFEAGRDATHAAFAPSVP